MLANDESVARGGSHSELLGHQEAESRGVQVGAGADDTVLGQPAELPGHVSQHVHRVAHDEQDSVGAVLNQLKQ